MSRKMLKVLILGAMVVSAIASSASSASAVTWTSNGSASGTAFTATAPTARLQVAGPPSVASICSNVSATGKAYGPGPSNLTDKAADVSLAFASCQTAGITSTVACNANSAGLYLTGVTNGSNVTPGKAVQNSNPVCVITIPSLTTPNLCTITVTGTGTGGQIGTGSYDNVAKALTISSAGQSLTATWTAGCTIFTTRPSTSSAVFGTNVNPPGNLTYTVTSVFKPIFTAS